MSNFDWYKVRFLESSANLKPLIKARTGRTPSTSIAREIAVCVQQGRLFYEAAAGCPLEIRPLLLFYGMGALARALVVARTLRPLSTLRHSHGLTDISEQRSRLRDLRVKVGATGTFQEFNDVVSPLSRTCYFGASSKPSAVYTASATSGELRDLELSLKDILSRIPGLDDLYRNTFNEEANTRTVMINFWAEYGDYCELRIDDSELFSDRPSLRRLVQKWRDRYPFLQRWRFVRAAHAWGNSVIQFANTECLGIDEFGEDQLAGVNGQFQMITDLMRNRATSRMAISSILPPMGGGYPGGYPNAIAPINGLYPSELSLHYLGLFLLSSLVRYRPDTWGHAISRSVLADEPTDDELLALLERFMEINVRIIPAMTVQVLNPHEDRYA